MVTDTDAVYPITVDPLLTSPSWTVEGDQAGAYLGWSVGTAGDVDGDGYSDVVVGVYGYDNGQTNEGRALVYLGSTTGLSTTASWTVDGRPSALSCVSAPATSARALPPLPRTRTCQR